MNSLDVQEAALIIKRLQTAEQELEKLNALSKRIAAERTEICVRLNLQHEDTPTLESVKDLVDYNNATSLHTHIQEYESLEVLGIMIKWRRDQIKEFTQQLKDRKIEYVKG